MHRNAHGYPIVLSPFVPAFGSPLIWLVGGLVGFFLPRFWLNRRKNSRLNAFNKMLPDTITLLANALRAGSSFLQAIEMVVRESRPPMTTEFARERSGAARDAKNAYRVSVLAAIATNSAPRRSGCNMCAVPSAMNCGRKAAKNKAVFGLRTATTNPSRTTRALLSAG